MRRCLLIALLFLAVGTVSAQTIVHLPGTKATLECTPNTNSKLSFYDEEFFEVNFAADPQNRYRRLSSDEIKHIVG